MPFSYLTHLECSRTGKQYDADLHQGLSEVGAPLLARYDLDAVGSEVERDSLLRESPTLWRYHSVLPVRDPHQVTSFGEGMTPLIGLPKYGRALGMTDLLMKDESLLPTGTFKARGAAVGVSRARELGVRAIAMPTNGNAGSAWSAYAARAGMRSLIVMPEDAPEVTRQECQLFGAELYLVKGRINDAGAVIAGSLGSRPDHQDASTLKEPYRIEGKKTMAYEIAEQLGWRLPDVILYPTGGGVGLIGIHKAIQEMLHIGWVQGEMPRLIAVQAEGCRPIVDAYESGAEESVAAAESHTLAFGINVPKALGDFLVLRAVRESGGIAVAVEDDETVHESRLIAQTEGAWICPEAAAAFAAVRKLREDEWLSGSESVVVLNTGNGLKYPSATPCDTPPLLAKGSVV